MPVTQVASRDTQSAALQFLATPLCRHDWCAFYDVLYREPPVYLRNNEWLLAGRNDVLCAMRNEGAELTALYPTTRSPAINELMLGMLPFESGADHQRLRALTRPLFSARTISQLQQHVLDLLKGLLYPAVFEDNGCDVLNTLGVRVPEAISCLLLDVARVDREDVGQWSRQIYQQIGQYDQTADELREAEVACDAFTAYVRRRTHEDTGEIYGGVGEALIAAWRRRQLNDQQLLSYFALFLLTGMDTLTHAIGNALWFLGNAPEVFSTLRNAPELSGLAFREAMRLWGPIRLCVRHLQNAVELDTLTLPQGSLVFLLVHAANRDPRRMERPTEVLWDRRLREDLAFGVGPHGCLGTALSRLIGQTLYTTLAERCRSLDATPDLATPSFIPSLPILGVESVRLYAQPGRISTGARPNASR